MARARTSEQQHFHRNRYRSCLLSAVAGLTSRHDILTRIATAIAHRYHMILSKALHLPSAIGTPVAISRLDSLPLFTGKRRREGFLSSVAALLRHALCLPPAFRIEFKGDSPPLCDAFSVSFSPSATALFLTPLRFFCGQVGLWMKLFIEVILFSGTLITFITFCGRHIRGTFALLFPALLKAQSAITAFPNRTTGGTITFWVRPFPFLCSGDNMHAALQIIGAPITAWAHRMDASHADLMTLDTLRRRGLFAHNMSITPGALDG